MANELHNAAKKVRSLPNQMVRAGNAALKKPLLDAYRRDSGGDLRLSGLRNSGRFTVNTSARGDAFAKGRVFMGGKMAGPAKWLNDGTKPRKQGAGFHPGASGKGTFDKTASAHLRDAEREMVRLFDQALR